MKAYICFSGDSSVGIYGEEFEMQIPNLKDYDEPCREQMRADIKKFYKTWMDEDCRVIFDDECEACGEIVPNHSKGCPMIEG